MTEWVTCSRMLNCSELLFLYPSFPQDGEREDVYRLSAQPMGIQIIKDSTRLESHKSSWESWDLLALPRLQTPSSGTGVWDGSSPISEVSLPLPGKAPVTRGQGSSFSQAEILPWRYPPRQDAPAVCLSHG